MSKDPPNLPCIMKSIQTFIGRNSGVAVSFLVGLFLMLGTLQVFAAPSANPPTGSPTANFNGMTGNGPIKQTSGNIRSATGEIYTGDSTTIAASGYGPGDIISTDDVYVDDDLWVGGDATILGALNVDAPATFVQPVNFNQNVSFTQAVDFTQNVSFSNPINVATDLTVQNLTVNGTFSGPGGSVPDPLTLDSITANTTLRTPLTGKIYTGTSGDLNFINVSGSYGPGDIMSTSDVFVDDQLFVDSNAFFGGVIDANSLIQADGHIYSTAQDVYAMTGNVFATGGKIYTGAPANWSFANISGSPTSVAALPTGAILATGNMYVDGNFYSNGPAQFGAGLTSTSLTSTGNIAAPTGNIFTGSIGNLVFWGNINGDDLASTDDLYVDDKATIGNTLQVNGPILGDSTAWIDNWIKVGTPIGSADSLGAGDIGVSSDLKANERVLTDGHIYAGSISGLPTPGNGDILAGDDIYANGQIGAFYVMRDDESFNNGNPTNSVETIITADVSCASGDFRMSCGGFVQHANSEYSGAWPDATNVLECNARARRNNLNVSTGNHVYIYAYCFA